MDKGWSNPEHVGKLTIHTLDILSRYFNEEDKKGDDKDMKLIIQLSSAMGYQSQIYAGLQKTFDMAKRVEEIEKVLETADPETLAMGMNPVKIAEDDLRTTFALR